MRKTDKEIIEAFVRAFKTEICKLRDENAVLRKTLAEWVAWGKEAVESVVFYRSHGVPIVLPPMPKEKVE